MENKINIAELLKDCPKGMELDCTMIDNVVFEKLDFISSHHPIIIRRTDSNKTIHLTKYGQYSDEEDYKCVIFPKGKTTWEGFQRPFKDGYIIFTRGGKYNWVSIFKQFSGSSCYTYVDLCMTNNDLFTGTSSCLCTIEEIDTQRLATEEEKARLFQAIKENGYEWNPKTKTLKKFPKFKVGDRIRKKGETSTYTITDVNNAHYFCGKYVICDTCDNDWELVPNKFDISTLKAFDKVLVRLTKDGVWNATFFSHYDKEVKWGCYPFVTTSSKSYSMCIPYEQNKHLLGTNNDCDKYFKIWES